MDKETAKYLLKFVNDPWVIDDLKIYMESRIQFLYKQMEFAQTMDEVRKHQGAIEELRRFKGLQEEVRSKAGA